MARNRQNKTAETAAVAPETGDVGQGTAAADNSPAGDTLESATHDAVVTIAEGDKGKLLRDHVGADVLNVAVTAWATSPMQFSAKWGDYPAAVNEAAGNDRFATFQSAVQAAIKSGFKGYKTAMVAEIAYQPPLIGDNTPQVMPWAEDADDKVARDALRAAGVHAAELVAGIIGGKQKERSDYLSLAADLVKANGIVASWSQGKNIRGDQAKASTAAWSGYVAEFFPAVTQLGKNTVSEAIVLGRAPEAVLVRWPEHQTSPKSFQSWLSSARKVFASAALEGVAPAAPLVAWNAATEEEPNLPKPLPPTLATIRAGLVSAAPRDTLEKLVDENNRLIAEKSKVQPKPVKLIDEMSKQVVAWRDAMAVGDWLCAELPTSDEALAKNGLVKVVLEMVAERWSEYQGYAAADAEVRKAHAKEEAAVAKRFVEYDIPQAVLHLFNIVKGHAEASAIVQGLVDRMAAGEIAEGETQTREEEEGDADLDPGAGEVVDTSDDTSEEEQETAAE